MPERKLDSDDEMPLMSDDEMQRFKLIQKQRKLANHPMVVPS